MPLVITVYIYISKNINYVLDLILILFSTLRNNLFNFHVKNCKLLLLLFIFTLVSLLFYYKYLYIYHKVDNHKKRSLLNYGLKLIYRFEFIGFKSSSKE